MLTKAKLKAGSHLQNFKLFVLQMVKLSNSRTYFVNEIIIEIYVVNYLLFATTRFASAGNGHLKREPTVSFTCSIVVVMRYNQAELP